MTDYLEAVAYWRRMDIRTPGDLETVLDSFRVLFAYHSGKIENERVTFEDTREIFSDGRVTGYTGDTRTIFEQQNQKLCYEFLVPKIIERTPLTEVLIQEIHRVLTSGTYDERRYLVNGERPGEYKKHDYVTGIHEVGAAVEDVASEMRELLEEVNGYTGDNILLPAAYLHARFEYIHPFADGNGRTGRTLLNYYLMTHGHPPIVIDSEDKRRYIEGLRTYDEQEDLQPLVTFLEEQTAKTWARAVEMEKGTKPPKPRKRLDDHTR